MVEMEIVLKKGDIRLENSENLRLRQATPLITNIDHPKELVDFAIELAIPPFFSLELFFARDSTAKPLRNKKFLNRIFYHELPHRPHQKVVSPIEGEPLTVHAPFLCGPVLLGWTVLSIFFSRK